MCESRGSNKRIETRRQDEGRDEEDGRPYHHGFHYLHHVDANRYFKGGCFLVSRVSFLLLDLVLYAKQRWHLSFRKFFNEKVSYIDKYVKLEIRIFLKYLDYTSCLSLSLYIRFLSSETATRWLNDRWKFTFYRKAIAARVCVQTLCTSRPKFFRHNLLAWYVTLGFVCQINSLRSYQSARKKKHEPYISLLNLSHVLWYFCLYNIIFKIIIIKDFYAIQYQVHLKLNFRSKLVSTYTSHVTLVACCSTQRLQILLHGSQIASSLSFV